MSGILVFRLFVAVTRTTTVLADGFGTAELKWAAHELFATQFLHGAACLFNTAHGDKGKAFRALSAVIHDDFGIAHAANATEELKQIALCSIVGKITDIQPLGLNFFWTDALHFTLRAWWAGRAALCITGAVPRLRGGDGTWECLGLAEQAKTDGAQELLKARGLDRAGAGSFARTRRSVAWAARATRAAAAVFLRVCI